MKRPAIGIFVFASALLHTAVLTISFPPKSISPTPRNNTDLNVTLELAFSDASPVPRNAAHASPHSHRQAQASAPFLSHPARAVTRAAKSVVTSEKSGETANVDQKRAAHTETYSSSEPSQPIATSKATASSTTEALANPVIATTTDTPAKVIAREIVSLMKIFRRFPPLARQRGWEGEVWLSFRLNQLGVIDNIQVARGSGFAILDQNAVDTLRRVGNIERSASWLPHDSIDVSLPVIYALSEG